MTAVIEHTMMRVQRGDVVEIDDSIRGVVLHAIGYCFQNPGVVFQVGEDVESQLLQNQVWVEDAFLKIPWGGGTRIIRLEICDDRCQKRVD